MSEKSRRVLLAGESWVSTSNHIKGFDQFSTVTFHLGAERFRDALAGSEFDLDYMPAHEAQRDFPGSAEALAAYDVVILSDIGANTLLLHPDTWSLGKRTPNRLKAIRSYVEAGGGFAMFGGYYSFQGISGGARFRATPVEEILPVNIQAWDDRVEVPEGFIPHVALPDHPVVAGLGNAWPYLLGFNEVVPKADATVVATTSAEAGDAPLLVLGTYGKGRTAAWTTDVGPHWLPPDFMAWPGYGRLWLNLLGWLARRG